MSYLEFTSKDIILMLIFAAILVLASFWARSFRKKQRNIIKYGKYFLIFSLCFALACVASLFIFKIHLGLDFTGGTILELKIPAAVTQSELQEVIVQTLGPDYLEPQVQKEEAKIGATGGMVKALIRLGKENTGKGSQTQNLSTDEVEKLMTALTGKFKTIEKIKVESIGPIIGGELFKKALWAILLGLLFQLIYISFRFGNSLRFGLAADIALLHDLPVMIGIYSIVGRQVDSPFIAAILTVIGYSVMDSIVIFDRIRENLKILKKTSFEETVNISVNETMTRSLNTLLTVLICLFALYFFGGSTLKNFAFALLIGCTAGAYSSICIAAPLVVLMDKWAKGREEQRVLARREELETKAAEKKAKATEKTEKKTTVTGTSYPSPSKTKVVVKGSKKGSKKRS